MSEYQDAVGRVIDDVVAPRAAAVDRTGTFPREAIDSLAAAGILGLTSGAEVGGAGQGLRQAADVIQRLAGACGSAAMVVLMHYSGTVVIENHGPDEVRRAIAAGRHLTTLAFSEKGSRSHFWAPQSEATADGADVRLVAEKSWVTSAADADSYVWSSRPVAAEGPMTLWLVPAGAAGLGPPGAFDGLGLRGNGSTPITAAGVRISRQAMLGEDGAGLDVALAEVLPWFLVMSAAFSVGLMEAVTAETGTHLTTTRLEHLDQALIEQPIARGEYARMRVTIDQAAALLADTIAALEASRPDAMLRVLEVKAAAGEAAIAVTDLAMKLCGGAAFRKEVAIERRFRDARAARVMAPTTDALLDFVGRAIGGLPLLGRVMVDALVLGAVAYDPKVVTIWDGFRSWFEQEGFAFDYVLYSNYERQVEELLAGRIDVAWNSPLAWVRARRLAAASGIEARALAMRDSDRDLTSVVVVRADSPIEAAADLGGGVVGTGAVDSPQATLLPVAHLRELGVDAEVRRFEVGVGLHGDHVGGERAAAAALVAGQVDAACMIDTNHLLFAKEGVLPPQSTRIIAQTAPYDHCNMTVVGAAPSSARDRFCQLLLAMDYGDSGVRLLLDLEGLKQWLPGRLDGYQQLERAVDSSGFYDGKGVVTAGGYRP